MNFLIDDNDSFKIEFFIDKNSNISETKKNDSCEGHFVLFKRPTYSDTVKINDSSIDFKGDSFKLNINATKMNAFKYLLRDWSFTDNNGSKIEPSLENVEKLNPKIAEYISDKLDDEL